MSIKFKRFEEEHRKALFELAQQVRERRLELLCKDRAMVKAFLSLAEGMIRNAMQGAAGEERNITRLMQELEAQVGIPGQQRRRIYDGTDGGDNRNRAS